MREREGEGERERERERASVLDQEFEEYHCAFKWLLQCAQQGSLDTVNGAPRHMLRLGAERMLTAVLALELFT